MQIQWLDKCLIAGDDAKILAMKTKKPELMIKVLPDDCSEQGLSCYSAPVQQAKKICSFSVMIFMQGFSVWLKKCYKCDEYEHFAKQCRSCNCSGVLEIVAATNRDAPGKVNVKITVDGIQANAIINTGSTLSYIIIQQYYWIEAHFFSSVKNSIKLA